MAPLSPARFLDAWAPSWFGLGLPLLLAVAYAVPLLRLRRSGGQWPPLRSASYLGGIVVLAWSLAGPPAAYREAVPWMGAMGVGLVAAVVGLGLALGDPVALWETATGRTAGWLRGRLARAIMFPLVASVVSAAVLTIAFTSTWYARAQVSPGSWALLQLTALAIGLLVNLPLLSEDLLPAWCGPGLKTLLAFVDGLLDAVPGIVVMTTVDKWVGGALLAVAEAVGVPMIFAVLAGWVRSDAREAAEVDAHLDAQEAAGEGGTTPWWLADPDLARRYGRRE